MKYRRGRRRISRTTHSLSRAEEFKGLLFRLVGAKNQPVPFSAPAFSASIAPADSPPTPDRVRGAALDEIPARGFFRGLAQVAFVIGLIPFFRSYQAMAADLCWGGKRIHLGVINTSFPLPLSAALYRSLNGRMVAQLRYIRRIAAQSS